MIEETLDTEKPMIVTRADGRDFVIMSAREFEALEETAHLLGNPKNARRLRASITEIETEIGRRHR